MVKPFPKEFIQKIRKEVLSGKSKNRVARELGISDATMYAHTGDIPSRKRAKPVDNETIKKIRKAIVEGKSKYQTAGEFKIHPKLVYRLTQDLPGKAYGWPGIRGNTLKLLQEILIQGYVLSSKMDVKNKYHILKKYFPKICKIYLNNRSILYLEDKAPVAARAFLQDIDKKIMSYQELKQISKVFGVDLSIQEKNNFLNKKDYNKGRKKQSGKAKKRSSCKEYQTKIDDFLHRFLPSGLL